ncbi:UNVERIFIED_CONTAM: hypothetical protein Slati_1450100 [Sesamum latifolium]|uniref:Retrotransposon gag protein n=1 Tax=Sesamum latifolium TaxID=2727402 RepID=A0AAW2X849_9LAMI
MPRSSRLGNLDLIPRSRRPDVDSKKKPSNSRERASTSSESETDLALDVRTSSDSEEEIMAHNPERTIKEMTSLDLNQQPLCIEYPTLEDDFELKSGLIHLLLTFRGLAGLAEVNRSLVDAASGGALYDKTPIEARKLITIMAANNQQFSTRNDNPPRKVNEVSASIDECLDEFTSLVKKFVVGGSQQVKACGICTSPGYFTDACPTLHEESTEQADAVGDFFQKRRYDPFFNTYNPGWRDHPNLSEKELQFKNSTRGEHAQQGKTDDENSIVCGHAEQGKTGEKLKIPPKQAKKPDLTSEEHPKVFVPKPPFPERFVKPKKEKEEKEILETLRKVDVNIPLLNAIKQVLRYAKFLNELCTNKSN